MIISLFLMTSDLPALVKRKLQNKGNNAKGYENKFWQHYKQNNQNSTEPYNSNQRMNKQFLRTPESYNAQKKWQINTTSSTSDEDCPYCLMKRKFNIGNSGEQKCFQHSIKNNLDHVTVLDNDDAAEKSGFMEVQELVDLLQDVEQGLDYYWDNLREISGGNATQIQKDLEPVLACTKRIQEKIGRFFYDNTIDVSQIKPMSTQTTLQKKLPHSISQKFLRGDLSNIFDPQEESATQSIKQWVMHFNKLIQLRQICQHDPLPYESDLEMRIFKQSMERKFMGYVQQITSYEKKVKDVLTKLIFYMEKSTENVSEKQIQEDILFIEGHQSGIETREGELERMLVMQASTMENMLFGNGGA